MNSWAILGIGALSQVFFSARVLVQWILSERARKVLSPTLFWLLSLCGSYLMCLYGFLRHDFAIVLGQFISYYVYLWNLKAKGFWAKLWLPVRWVLLLTPPVALVVVVCQTTDIVGQFFGNADVPLGLLLFGSFGQVLFTFRFIYQFLYSRSRHESILPKGFWIISLAGASSICLYGLIRHDPILILGQSFGMVSYVRNLWIGSHNKVTDD